MKQLNLKFYLLAILCFAGLTASAQDTQEICIGDTKNYSVTENPGSTYAWEVEEPTFEGTIKPIGAGNEIDIDWGTTPIGTYTLTVIETNNENCPGKPVSAMININPLPDIPQVALTQPGCGEEFGSMIVTSPTDADIQYSIDDGTNFQSDVNFTDLNPGTYEVIAQNALGCTSEPKEFVINDPLEFPQTPVVDVTQPECGDTNGSLEITEPTGTGLEYSIDGGTTFTTDLVYANLTPGDYTVVVSNGDCESQDVFTIDPAPTVPETPAVTVTNPECGDTTGSLKITAPTETGLEYSIDGGTTFTTDLVYANLTPGDYTVVVSNGDCESQDVFTIDPAPIVPETPVVTVTNPECGDTTGSLKITAPTETGLTYSINGGAFTTDLVYANLTPGDYTVVVSNGDCESQDAFTIDPAPSVPADPEFSILNPGCGETEGTITITKPLGSDLEYSADGGTTWKTDPEFVLSANAIYQIQVKNTLSGCTSRIVDATIQEAPEVPVTSPIQFN